MADLDLTVFYGQFRDETRENLDILEQGLTALEAQPDDVEQLDRMLRAIHTTKGSAKIMGFGQINRLAHEMEDVLGAIRKGELELSSEVGTVLFQASAGLRTLTDNCVGEQEKPVDVAGLLDLLRRALGTPSGAPEKAAEPEHSAPSPVVTMAAPSPVRLRETMRVDLKRLDQLATQVGQILSLQNRAQEMQASLRELGQTQRTSLRALETLKEYLEKCRPRLRPNQAAEISQSLGQLEDTLHQQAEQWQDLFRGRATLQERFSLALSELHQETLAIRMQPISTIFERFPGVVRRIAAECGVEITMEIQGGEVELDRRVLDLLRDPLIHLVRNALDHGIEPPTERERLGKARRGRIILQARQLGRRVLVEIQDDGQGIDLERVRHTAVERDLLNEKQAQETDDDTLIQFLFQAGFSTREEATDMSGRGVGLNIVQTAIRQLNGLVQVHTQAGRGTTFILDVPLTLATIRVLFVQAGGETLAIPSAAIRSLVRVQSNNIVPVEGKPTLRWQDRNLPLFSLAETLGFPTKRTGRGVLPAVIAGSNGRQVALTVERVLDESEAVVQPLGKILEQNRFFSAATLSGTDQVIPILDLSNLLVFRSTAPRAEPLRQMRPVSPRDIPTILLVEDTITTRELERSILEAAGYRIVTAFDGIDALEKLEQHDLELVITDIEMPRMDGFELTAHMRQDARWEDLPIIIITAREDESSHRHGLQIGAQAYVIKSRFDQSNLLEIVAQWLGQPQARPGRGR